MAYANNMRAVELDLVGRIMNTVRSLRASMQEARAERSAIRLTVRELRALSDRDLNDLGIARADITAIAKGATPR